MLQDTARQALRHLLRLFQLWPPVNRVCLHVSLAEERTEEKSEMGMNDFHSQEHASMQ